MSKAQVVKLQIESNKVSFDDLHETTVDGIPALVYVDPSTEISYIAAIFIGLSYCSVSSSRDEPDKRPESVKMYDSASVKELMTGTDSREDGRYVIFIKADESFYIEYNDDGFTRPIFRKNIVFQRITLVK